MTQRGILEELQVFRQMPGKFSAAADDAVGSHGGDGDKLGSGHGEKIVLVLVLLLVLDLQETNNGESDWACSNFARHDASFLCKGTLLAISPQGTTENSPAIHRWV
jgi:hypothetical protein